MEKHPNVSDVITALGGTSAVAKLFGIKPPSVSEWKANGCIPPARLMYLEVVRPDLFGKQSPTSSGPGVAA